YQHSVGIAGSIPLDAATRRILCKTCDPCGFECLVIEPPGMSIHPFQYDGPIGYDGVELARQRKASQTPRHLVPTGALQPGQLRMRHRIGLDPGLCLAESPGTGQPDLCCAGSEREYMAMRIDQSRQQGTAVSIDPVRVRMTLPEQRCVACLDHLSAVEHHRFEAVELTAGQRIAVDVFEQCRSAIGNGRGEPENDRENERPHPSVSR